MHLQAKGFRLSTGTIVDATHMGVDARHKLIHRIVATSGAVSDGEVLPQLLHGN